MKKSELKGMIREVILNEIIETKVLKKGGDVELQYARRHDGKEWYRVTIPGGVFIFNMDEKKKAESQFKQAVLFLKGLRDINYKPK